jgi:hypothetical protein
MKAKRIKGFPPSLHCDWLNANTILPICALVSIRRCASAAFSSGNELSISGFTRPSRNSGITLASIAATIAALSALVRGRSVEPVWVSRFTITLAMLTVTLGPLRVAICTIRPSTAAAS